MPAEQWSAPGTQPEHSLVANNLSSERLPRRELAGPFSSDTVWGYPEVKPPEVTGRTGGRWSRRRVLTVGAAGVAAVFAGGALGVELVSHGILPGQQELDEIDAACSVVAAPLRFSPTGVSRSGRFYSRARGRNVGYTIAWPPDHEPGTAVPLIVMLHGEGANHANALTGMTPAQAVALEMNGAPLPPMAMVTVDGGTGYWNPHPGDDPMAMVIAGLRGLPDPGPR